MTSRDTKSVYTQMISLRMPYGLLEVVKRRAPDFGMTYQQFLKALVQQGLFYLNEHGSLTMAVESLEEEHAIRAHQRAHKLALLKAERQEQAKQNAA